MTVTTADIVGIILMILVIAVGLMFAGYELAGLLLG
jgi:hypothetical protein